MRRAFVTAGGQRLRVGRAGAGPPLLLIAGIGASIDMWAPLVERLPGRELVAFDAPGTGGSPRPRRPLRDPAVLSAHAGARLRRPPDPLGYAYQLCAGAGWTSLPWLHRLTMPALVLAGDDDPSVPVRNARLLAARLPDATLHVIRGGGHLFLLDQPEDAVPVIERLLVSGSQ